MPKTSLETAIEKAAAEFALTVVEAVKRSSLEELMALQESSAAPVKKPRKKPGRKPKSSAAKKAKVKWPICKKRGCTKNAWARGKGYCGEHYREMGGR